MAAEQVARIQALKSICARYLHQQLAKNCSRVVDGCRSRPFEAISQSSVHVSPRKTSFRSRFGGRLVGSARAPLVAIGAECRPAIPQPHKWDKPRNPLPFGRIAISIEEPLCLEEFRDASDVESARRRLQQALDHAHQVAAVAATTLSTVM